jgi:hypothetical protein
MVMRGMRIGNWLWAAALAWGAAGLPTLAAADQAPLEGAAIAAKAARSAAPASVQPIVTEWFDVGQSSGAKFGDNSGHGGNQTRIVRASHGVYAAYIDGQFADGWYSSYALVKIQGVHATRLYGDKFPGGSSSPYVMADADGDIWSYVGGVYGDENRRETARLSVAHYNPKTGETTPYTQLLKYPENRSFGYSSAILDPAQRKIYAVFCGGDRPGYFSWSVFDLASHTWSGMNLVEVPYRHCYLYGFGDGQGGLRLVAERDVTTEAAGIADALKQYRNRKIDANYVWDELRLFTFPNLNAAAVGQVVAIETAAYDCAAGWYPNVKNNTGGDALVDRDGHLHVLYTRDDNGRQGRCYRHAIYDARNTCLGNYELALSPKFGEYELRLYQSTSGAFYVVAAPVDRKVSAQVQIWKSVDSRGIVYRLAHEHCFEGYATPYSLIMSSTRNGSRIDNRVDCLLALQNHWYHFALDFGALE